MDELELTSPAFQHGRSIPRKHTCEGEDVSPPLAWSGVPQGTASLALVVDDPDAPGDTSRMAGLGYRPDRGWPRKVRCRLSRAGTTSARWGGRGPCPPPGHGPHRYVFQLHALDGELEFPGGTAKAEVDRAIADHALGVAELGGIYER
jgi:phosphatidylethanolamine-binding protein (PEBP) family uncharacterized protein